VNSWFSHAGAAESMVDQMLLRLVIINLEILRFLNLEVGIKVDENHHTLIAILMRSKLEATPLAKHMLSRQDAHRICAIIKIILSYSFHTY